MQFEAGFVIMLYIIEDVRTYCEMSEVKMIGVSDYMNMVAMGQTTTTNLRYSVSLHPTKIASRLRSGQYIRPAPYIPSRPDAF